MKKVLCIALLLASSLLAETKYPGPQDKVDDGGRYEFLHISSGEWEGAYVFDSQTGRLWRLFPHETTGMMLSQVPFFNKKTRQATLFPPID
jgi:hypothetical protein